MTASKVIYLLCECLRDDFNLKNQEQSKRNERKKVGEISLDLDSNLQYILNINIVLDDEKLFFIDDYKINNTIALNNLCELLQTQFINRDVNVSYFNLRRDTSERDILLTQKTDYFIYDISIDSIN